MVKYFKEGKFQDFSILLDSKRIEKEIERERKDREKEKEKPERKKERDENEMNGKHVSEKSSVIDVHWSQYTQKFLFLSLSIPPSISSFLSIYSSVKILPVSFFNCKT